MIKIYDTKLREKTEFVPCEQNKVRMYVCGPTVYNRIHIGNARTFASFDTIRRYLLWRGYDVVFVQNVTDVDDKIIKRANEEGKTASEVASAYTKAFIEDMHALNVLDPTYRPKATEEIKEMIKLVKELIAKGHAYEVEGDVYFEVRSYSAYGQLSGRNIDEMESGHRELRADGQGLEDRKRDPLDFALWKAAKPGEPSWPSPWGQGRPGWHIECSAMSRKYLGLPFDIHGGGADLVFPHHENERAQSEASCDCTFANHWMHSGMLQINSEKMSKSLGNFMLLHDVLNQTETPVLRMLFAQTHYRSPLDYCPDRIAEAQTSLGRIENCLKDLAWAVVNAKSDEGNIDNDVLTVLPLSMKQRFVEAMDDDFNAPAALGEVFVLVNEINSLVVGKSVSCDQKQTLIDIYNLLVELMGVFGVNLPSLDQMISEVSGGAIEYPQGIVTVAGFPKNLIAGKEVVKVIAVPGKLVNRVVK